MLRAISETAVAISVRSVPRNPARAATSRACLPGDDDVGVPRHRHAALRPARRAPAGARAAARLKIRADVAGQQVAGDVELGLPAAVGGRQGEQGRPAAVGRGVGAALGEQVLDAEPGAGAGQPGGDGARRGTAVRGQRGGVRPLDLVREEELPVRLRQPAQGEVDQRSVHPTDRLVLRAADLRRPARRADARSAGPAGLAVPQRRSGSGRWRWRTERACRAPPGTGPPSPGPGSPGRCRQPVPGSGCARRPPGGSPGRDPLSARGRSAAGPAPRPRHPLSTVVTAQDAGS